MFTILILIVFCSHSSVCYVGKACKSDSSCKDEEFLTYDPIENEYQCVDGVCKCKTMEHLRFDDDTLTPSCSLLNVLISSIIRDKTCTSDSACSENAECVGQESPLDVHEKRCICKAGFMLLQDTCREVSHQRVLEKCKIQETSPVLFCDLKESSYCKSGRCICFDTFFANTTSGKCEPVSEYLQMHNLTRYRVSPGEYCSQDNHCIEGLTCVNFSCSCPPACPYKADKQVCDCGKEPTSLYGPVIVGILAGILIIAFWAYQIRKTFERHGKKKRDQFDDLSANSNEGTPACDAHPLKPVDSHAVTHGTYVSPGPLNPPPSSTDGRQSPVAPPVVPSYAVPPPQPSLYGINPPQAPYPQNSFPQPSQAENSSETNPPPYSLNPPTVGSSATSLPYPVNSPAAPSPTNPSGMPFGLDPSAPPPSSPYGASAPHPYNPSYP